MVNSIEVIECDSPFYIEELPLGNKVYVFDNYLSAELHHHTDSFLRNQTNWQKNYWSKSRDASHRNGRLPSKGLYQNEKNSKRKRLSAKDECERVSV